MAKSGQIEYKCRRCGEVFSDTHGNVVDNAILELVRDGNVSIQCGGVVTMIHVHNCNTTPPGIGIADCIGATYTGGAGHDER